MAAGLADTLAGPGPFTVFAPDNRAFEKLSAETVEALNADTELLKKVISYHVVLGNIMSKDISNGVAVDSVEGSALRTNLYLNSKYYDVCYMSCIDVLFILSSVRVLQQ